ncbi:MAG: tetratricopeptide repeat protein [Bacteroidaceae bacterium]|jgi:tetratricopeptide (TPR) repeat protein|nr:tetratricopeptide repeat protein [Bacteroidaceae bacterium]
MKMKNIISAFLLFILPVAAISQENTTQKELGDKAYAESKFEDAVEIYEAALAEQGPSAALYYNLGNAYYRTNNPGKAILNYERALKIDADDEDAKANLEFVQSKIVDKIPQDDVPFYRQWGNALFGLFSKDTWGVIGVVSFAVMLAMLFLYLFKSNARRISMIVVVISLLFVILANVSAAALSGNGDELPEGIILDEMVVVKSSPDSYGTELTKIHEGLKVVIIDDTLADWVKIEANNGNRVVGWVKAKSLEQI